MHNRNKWADAVALGVTVWVGALLLLPGVPAVAADLESASLRGVVRGPDGVLEGVPVEVENQASGRVRRATTGRGGVYHIVGLRPGNYQVRVGEGATGEGQSITLRVGQTANLDFALTPPAAQRPDIPAPQLDRPIEEVVVTASQTESFAGGEVGTSLTPELIDRLPQINRNFLSFADLAPGVQFIQRSDGTATIRGGAQHQRGVNVFLDGVSQKDYVLKGGITGQDTSRGNPFPQSAIAEYRVITQNYKAEYENVSSTAITAVTASGTNEFRARVFGDHTNEHLREPTPLEEESGEKVASEQSQYGATVSGPILRDRLHYLFAYEAKDNEDPVDVIPGAGFDPADLPEEFAELVGRQVTEFEEDLYFGKLDWYLNDSHDLALTVKYRDESGTQGIGDANTASYGTAMDLEETRVQLKHTWRAERWQNELRLTWEDSQWSPNPITDGVGRVLQTAANETILQVGAGRNFQRKGQEGWGIENEFTLLDVEWLGLHTFKAGIKYNRVTLNSLQQQPANPQYFYNVEFGGPGTFELVQPHRLEVGVPLGPAAGALETDTDIYGLYVQDDWDVTDRLSLHLGVRWDYEETPSYKNYQTPPDVVAALRSWPNINNPNAGFDVDDWISTGSNRDYDSNNIAPRFGFSYLLDGEGRHELYGGYGRSYDRNQFDFLQLEVTQGTFGTLQFQFQGDPANPCEGDNCLPWDPIYLTEEGRAALVENALIEGGGRELDLLSNDLKTPYSDQYSIGVRSNWGTSWSTDLTYSHVESKDGFNWLLGNRREGGLFFAPGTTWGAPFGFPPPGFGNLLLSSNDLETESDSVYLKVERFHDDNWGFSVAYTYTDAEENRDYDGQYTLDYPTIDGYGVLDSIGVPTHRVVAVGTVDLPWAILLSAKLTVDSGTPYQVLDCLAGDDHCRYDRIEPDDSNFRQLDLSLAKSFSLGGFTEGAELRVRLDVINVFDTRNWIAFDTNPGTADAPNPNFGEHQQSVAATRTAKLSVDVSW